MTSPEIQPFTQDALNKIFILSTKHPDRIVTRESNTLEFKEAFSFGSLGKYIRTAAGFANARGGYIVYGVENAPHKLVGLKNDAFTKLDPEKLTHFLNEHFDPVLQWEQHLYELGGKTFGILYFHESTNKPVVCKRNADDPKHLKEGEIYYRYRGRTQTIRYAELKQLIDERRLREQLLWFKHLKEIARVGTTNAAIFDLKSGVVQGASGAFIIDESLLPQLAFIREGEFSETRGTPTLKLIGSLQSSTQLPYTRGGKPQVIKTQGIRSPDIVRAFLKDTRNLDARAYVTQICYESSAFLPFYAFLQQSGSSIVEAKGWIANEHSTMQAKRKLLARMEDDSSLAMPLPSSQTEAGERKMMLRDKLLTKKLPVSLKEPELLSVLDLVRTMTEKDLGITYLRELLLKIFDTHFARQKSTINDKIRRAVCYIDWLHFCPNRGGK